MTLAPIPASVLERAAPVARPRWRSAITGRAVGFLALLVADVLSGICFSLIASRRWSAMPAETVVFTISYAQWINLGVTAAKLGFDTYLYAAMTRSGQVRFDLDRFLLRYSLPVAAGVALTLLMLFDFWDSVTCGVIVLLETASVLMVSEQSARQRYTTSALNSLLRYPLFFLLLLPLACWSRLDHHMVVAALGTAAVVRFLVARKLRTVVSGSGWSPRPNVWCAVNQPLNFLLFRVDQLLLPALASPASAGLGSDYAYLAKWPELVSGLVSTAGLVWFPRGRQLIRAIRRGDVRAKRLLLVAAVGYLLALPAMAWIYSRGTRSTLPLTLVAPFAVQSLLVLPVNFGGYLLLRTDRVPGLVRKAAQALGLGVPLLLSALLLREQLALAWAVPLQLLTFVVLLGTRS